MDDAINDPRFVSLLKRGDERAFTILVRRCQNQVFSLCCRFLSSPEDAREVAQEVFVAIFKQIQNFKGDAKLTTWVYRIATNHALNRLKYLKRRNHDQLETLRDELDFTESGSFSTHYPGPEEMVAAVRLERYLNQQLALLDEEQRTVVVLRDMEGLSYQDIVEVTGLNLGTIKSRLHRGRSRIKQALDSWMAGVDPGITKEEER
jgi:RNA polymerase sigma-70 factor (ECF subfamily)